MRTDELETETFDSVCVCIGHHVYPHVPVFPRLEEFKGKIMHTHSPKKVDGLDNLRILEREVNNSGMDSCANLSALTKKVFYILSAVTWAIRETSLK
ncbi:dimethylaniline monooxygenase [Nephila pilipes]|uniref:Flavin-containing monooxygenase n=1 Tax=Nephila pilipes TaxID=299642 RepID=A0A8X6TC36_NEPPI|nr:dimethylaniline monooxygenase [Nephila pilipes]